MKIAMNLLKAEHVGVRDLKSNLSKRLKSDRMLIVTDHNQPKKIIVSYEEMLSLLDMLDELTDSQTVQAVAEGRKAVANGTVGIPVSKMIGKWRKEK